MEVNYRAREVPFLEMEALAGDDGNTTPASTFASMKGLFTIPDIAKTDLIGKTRKVGRPRKFHKH